MNSNRPSLKKGILGGTFDPIHIGHLQLAKCALEEFDLDEVLFLPAGNPPHKQKREGGATDYHRLAMVQIAIAPHPGFHLDAEEMGRTELTYTRDTLARLKAKEPETEFFFIIGADSLMAFDTWWHPEEICRYSHLLVALRDGIKPDAVSEKIEEYKMRYHASIHLMHCPMESVSSSELRERIKAGRSVSSLVPEGVAEYIEAKAVYGG